MTDKVISWKEWEDMYQPTTDTMIDFWSDAEGMMSSPYHVWTVVDNNPNSVYLDILPGLRLFNRLGFFVTKYSWDSRHLVVSNDPSYQE